MKNIHYLYYMTPKMCFCHLLRFVNLNILENGNSVLITPLSNG